MLSTVLFSSFIFWCTDFFRFAHISQYDDTSFFDMVFKLVPGAFSSEYTFTFFVLVFSPVLLSVVLPRVKEYIFVKYAIYIFMSIVWLGIIITSFLQGEFMKDASTMYKTLGVDLFVLLFVSSLSERFRWFIVGPIAIIEKIPMIELNTCVFGIVLIIIIQMPTLYLAFLENNTFSLSVSDDSPSINSILVQIYIVASAIVLFSYSCKSPDSIKNVFITFLYAFLLNYNVALGLLFIMFQKQTEDQFKFECIL